MSDERDQLLEALLCEAFGRDAPPDLTERICRRAYAVSVWHNPWLLGTALVTAAAGARQQFHRDSLMHS